MASIPRASGSRRMILLFMAVGLVFMLAVSLSQRLANPHLVVEAQQRGGMGQAAGGMSSEVGALMQKVAQNPNDYASVIHLTEHLVTDKQWDAAENFARRAMVVSPGESQPWYLLGVILHNKGQNKEAAEALERAVTMKDEASLRYSLGVLYIYYLNDAAKGVQHLTAGLHAADASDALKKVIREELEKAPLPGAKPKESK